MLKWCRMITKLVRFEGAEKRQRIWHSQFAILIIFCVNYAIIIICQHQNVTSTSFICHLKRTTKYFFFTNSNNMTKKIGWSTLIGYGIIFWVFLCLTDLLGPPYTDVITVKEIEELCRKPDLNQPEFTTSQLFIVIGNSLLVMLTMVLCTMFIITSRIAWSIFSKCRNKEPFSKTCSLNQYPEQASSRNIPVSSSNKNVEVQTKVDNLLKRYGRNLDVTAKTSKTCLLNECPTEKVESSRKIPFIWDQSPNKNGDVQKSCPNLVAKRSGNNLETIDHTAKTCRSLYRTNLSIPENGDLGTEEQLNIECETLKEEMHRVQNFSIKEHSYLSRNLVDALKENKELTKQIVVLTNENTIFKKQIRYLFQQREMLTQELELAKVQFQSFLEKSQAVEAKFKQFSDNIENLKKNLVQAFENHKVLEYNLLVSDIEIIKLNSRVTKMLIRWQQPLSSELDYRTKQLLEIDDKNGSYVRKNMAISCGECKKNPTQCTDPNQNAVTRSAMDIMKIKEKLKELEEHFENLASTSDDDNSSRNSLEPKVTLSGTAIGSLKTNEIQEKLNKLEKNARNLTRVSDKYDQNSTKSSDDHDNTNTTYATMEIQDPIRIHLAKCKQFGNMRTGSTPNFIQEPKRLVSSSIAFNNFMKNLNKFDAPKKIISINQGIYF
ncbi:unnamed protein product [Ceutorhynchus assimilis]|uniref:Uncharacterized protein n=1 Tax=Ceutorhynchus assimilis TaxID=467358 RepID=A0A9P0DKA1_9CUCU|nr:unnamed protein product [Ceutorhynchus assimilis]